MTQTVEKQTHAFETEVKQLLQLMIHSLYSDKEIFLRELVSNASDALDKLRFESLQNDTLKPLNQDLRIRVAFDKNKGTITVEDNGIGMSEAEVIENLGTIAKSGTKSFVDSLTGEQKHDAALIGQFGVGFYASFMVADKVSVYTRRADASADEAVLWESKGDGEYTLEPVEKNTTGTTITLHLKKGEEELLNDWKLRDIIIKYSDHISFPVEMLQAKAEDENEEQKSDTAETFEAVNKATALWTRSKSDITEEEYKKFYQHVSHDFQDPLAWTHNRVEGKTEYTNVLFIPKKAPFDLYQAGDKRHGVKLYVRRVYIMDDAEQFMPNYLRFVKGVIDANDLPLNVSREILQRNKVVDTIKAGSVKKVLSLLESLAKDEPQDYIEFWKEFGPVLKEGIVEDANNREQIAKLARFATTKTDEPGQTVSLDEYLDRMQDGQDKIYFVTGETFQAAKSSPHLEVFRKKGIEVLLLSDRVDEWVTMHLAEYQGKKLESVAKGALDIDSEEEKAEHEAQDKDFEKLITAFKTSLGDKVKDVRITRRLTDSPSCVVADENDMGLQMQRIFKAAGQAMPASAPILELNPDHALLQRLNADLPGQDKIADWATLLLNQAILAEGAQLDDPAGFVKVVNSLLGESN